jgi:hypothetical protein
MNLLLIPFLLLSAVGFVLSLIVHLAGLAGIAPPGGGLVWGLHAGAIVVSLPVVLVATRIAGGLNHKDAWKVMLSGCPNWMRQAFFVLFAYAILNFLWFAVTTSGQPKPKGVAPPSVIRGFSGHWMVFYAAAFATLYSVIQAPELLRRRNCPEGHPVSVTDHFCPRCGRLVEKKTIDE